MNTPETKQHRFDTPTEAARYLADKYRHKILLFPRRVFTALVGGKIGICDEGERGYYNTGEVILNFKYDQTHQAAIEATRMLQTHLSEGDVLRIQLSTI